MLMIWKSSMEQEILFDEHDNEQSARYKAAKKYLGQCFRQLFVDGWAGLCGYSFWLTGSDR